MQKKETVSEYFTTSALLDAAGQMCLSPAAPRVLRQDLHAWEQGGNWQRGRALQGCSSYCLH